MSTTSGLAAIAYRVDALLLHPASMARARELAEACLADPELGHVDALFPDHPEEPILDRDPIVAVQTPGQRALALAALHEVYCAGVEKVVAVPADLTWGAVLADDQLIPAWLRAVRWAAILDNARGLADWARPWFELQMRRFEQEFPVPAGEVPTLPADEVPNAPAGEFSTAPADEVPPSAPAEEKRRSNSPAKIDPCIHALVLLAEAQRKGEEPTVTQLAGALGINRSALYENKAFAPFRQMANALFNLFEEEAKPGDWQGPRGSKGKDGTMEAMDTSEDSER